MIPFSLNIGLTNRCNCKCTFCPISETKIPRVDMPLETALRIISEVKVDHHVSLALFGESTLYKDLGEVIKAVKRKGVESILYTNGIRVSGEVMADIINCGLDKIVFSLDATSREEYLKTKGVDAYDKVCSNIRTLMKIKRKNPFVIVQYAGLDYEQDAPGIPADMVKRGRFISWGGEVAWQGKIGRKIRESKPCTHIFKFLNVASNGDVVMCCIDYNHSIVLGNIYKENIMNIWNSERFNELRKQQIEGEFSDLCLNCENESYYYP